MRVALRSALIKLLIVIGSVVVSAAALEGAVRLYLLMHTVYDVEMTRYALLMKEPSPNPRIGHVHKPNTSATLMNVPVHINSDGLRDAEHTVARDERYRIAFVGDSFTFGWGVREPDTFKARIETLLNRRYPVEIINFGTGNYNTEQEVNLFIDKGLKYRPDKVVVFYFINDAEPMQQPAGLAFLYHSQLVTYVWSRVRALLSDYGDRTHNYKGYYADLYGPESAGWQRAQAAFVRLRDVCRQHGIELQVVLIPELHELHDYAFADQHRLVMDFLRRHDIPALDLAPLFRDESNPSHLWVSADDAHANALGHALIAERSLDFVAARRTDGAGRAAPADTAPAPQ